MEAKKVVFSQEMVAKAMVMLHAKPSKGEKVMSVVEPVAPSIRGTITWSQALQGLWATA